MLDLDFQMKHDKFKGQIDLSIAKYFNGHISEEIGKTTVCMGIINLNQNIYMLCKMEISL